MGANSSSSPAGSHMSGEEAAHYGVNNPMFGRRRVSNLRVPYLTAQRSVALPEQRAE